MAKASSRALVGAGLGILTGMGLKYLWESFKGPGYGQALFAIPTSPGQPTTFFGADDAAVSGVGAVIAAIGYKKRDAIVSGLGAGTVIGVFANKLLETQNVYVCPFDGVLANGHNCNSCR